MPSTNNLLLQSLNLLSQQITKIQGEEIYGKTGAMEPSMRELIGLLSGVKLLPGVSKETSELAESLIPFFSEYGKACFPRTELTDLGFRVSDRGAGNINIEEEEEANIQEEEEAEIDANTEA